MIRLLSCILTVLAVGIFSMTANAQTKTKAPTKADSKSDKSQNAGSVLKPVESQIWEFGLKVSASTHSTGVSGTFPIPSDWPEQKVTLLEPVKSAAIDKFYIRKLRQNARMILFRIPRLAAGQSAEFKIRIKIEKCHQALPLDPSRLSLPTKIPGYAKQYLRPSPFIESRDKRILEIARKLKQKPGQSDFKHVESIYNWVRDNVEYQFDKQIKSCIESLDLGHGDCEELSSLFVAICRAQGIPARAVWIPSHTYPEFLMVDEKGNEHWIPCQAAGSYEFGAMTESRPILQKGDKFKVPGEPKPVRYVKPTLEAKDSGGGLQIEWIMNPVASGAMKSAPSGGLLRNTSKNK